MFIPYIKIFDFGCKPRLRNKIPRAVWIELNIYIARSLKLLTKSD